VSYVLVSTTIAVPSSAFVDSRVTAEAVQQSHLFSFALQWLPVPRRWRRNMPAPFAKVTQTSTVRFVGSLAREMSETCPVICSAA